MWERVKMAPPKQGFDLLKLTDYHLSDVGVSAFVGPGHPAFSLVLSGIALLILVLACVNSLNLSLAQSSSRLKEVGVRRVIGARKGQLVGQLMTESFIAGMGALIVGLTSAGFLIGPFNAVTGKRLAERSLLHPETLLIVFFAILAVSLLTGLIPALSISRVQAGDVFRGRFLSEKKGRLSLIFIVFQFTVSLFFIIGSLVITRQLHFMTSTDLGYDPSSLILVRTQDQGNRHTEGSGRGCDRHPAAVYEGCPEMGAGFQPDSLAGRPYRGPELAGPVRLQDRR
jgi:putative ABC transport system permease protein